MPPVMFGVNGSDQPPPHRHASDARPAVVVATSDPALCPGCGTVEPQVWFIRPQPAHCSPGCGQVYLATSAALLCLTCLKPTAYVPVVRAGVHAGWRDPG